jgi:hypothetical protein
MTKQERVTFVINTLKELIPYHSCPFHKDLYFIDSGFAIGAMHRRAR